MNPINYLLNLSLILISINIISPSEIKIIPDANLNATSAFASLQDIEKPDFLYFTFDFNYHNNIPNKEKDEAYFKITTELFLTYRDFQFTFLEKKQEEVILEDLVPQEKYIFWKYAYLISNEKDNNEYNYYLQINRRVDKNTKNTLVLKIPVDKKEGQITVENLFSLPEEVLEKKNTFKNVNNWPKYNINENKDDKYHHRTEYNEYKNNIYNKPEKTLHNYNGYNNYDNNYHQKNKIFYPPKNHRYHWYYGYYRIFYSLFLYLGIILFNIWVAIFILYCIVNRRKKPQLAIVVGNIQQ